MNINELSYIIICIKHIFLINNIIKLVNIIYGEFIFKVEHIIIKLLLNSKT